jgi:hypothetical protein
MELWRTFHTNTFWSLPLGAFCMVDISGLGDRSGIEKPGNLPVMQLTEYAIFPRYYESGEI